MLNNRYGHVIAFTHAIDEACQLKDDTSTGLFWAVAITASALEAGIELVDFIRLLRKLDTAFPKFGVDVSRYRTDLRIQQNIFSQYIDCYLPIIEHLTEGEEGEDETASDLDSFILPLIREADTKIKKYWDTMLVIARQNEERELRKLVSATTYVNGIHGEGHGSNNVRFRFIRHLGTGSYGDVSEMEELSTGNVYARKLFRYHDESQARRVETEVKNKVKVMPKLRHHHIASVLLWVRDPDSKNL
ncbi:uncharacterized protein Z518_08766 [Rhinocladiella mackenziei CBS 650.93]|uniref:Rhinocladiella mackenziei CBS 650.93 unplaced genomic scaffold supercont1.6, whole genome shotgun sequence n=1 Tax=Rhinocladiella mackenziei CBS 650.93 TaxID=1442369 RepID=A0A0D2GXA6_9EURO|nr:uncharacterized protein Z518_08766 [Rhinocladiella mackenziei CBS 650.93]KIX02823.1 hypothetical protein Z518_08766 [Rhinocladiella mackenziei CBS 650.93]